MNGIGQKVSRDSVQYASVPGSRNSSTLEGLPLPARQHNFR